MDHVTVIDVEQGARLVARRVVVVGNRIQAIGSPRTVRVPRGARVVNASGKYLIPGLWDMHIHPSSGIGTTTRRTNTIYRHLVTHGITGIRDPGAELPLDTFRVWKREIAAGRRVGPRLIVSGPSFEHQPAGKCTRESHAGCTTQHVYIDRPEQARHLVDSLKAAGADFIKIHGVPRSLWFAIAREARRAGIPFGGHFNRPYGTPPASARLDGLDASDSGAVVLDHELYSDVCAQGFFQDARDTVKSLTQCSAAAAQMRRNGTWLAGGIGGVLPPDSLWQAALRYGALPGQNDTGWRPLTAAQRRRLPRGAELAAAVPDSARYGPSCQKAWLAYAADLPWVPGPDYPLGPVLGAHWSVLAPTLCGVPASWVLRAITLNPARALRLTDSLGTVAAGKVADLVLLTGDPLEDIWNITKVEAVLANGRYFDRAALNQLGAQVGAEWLQLQEAAKARQRATPAQTSSEAITAFVDVAVVPMDRERVLLHQVVVVQGDRITAMGSVEQVKVPARAVRIDGRGKYLIPGLADMHVHLSFGWRDTVSTETISQMKQALRRYAAQGVTMVRDMWGQPATLAMKTQVGSGATLGPRIYVAVRPGLEGLAHLSRQPDSAVRLAKAAGFDLIKFWINPRGKELDDILTMARRVGLPIAGHAPQHGDNGLAVQEGYTSVEHMLGFWGPQANASDSAQLRATAVALKEAGVWVCPTLNHILQQFLTKPSYGLDSAVVHRAVRMLRDVGVGLLAGTDGWPTAPTSGYFVSDELAALVRAGLTPYEALAAATRNPAAYFGVLDSVGTVEVRKRANLVLLPANPLTDIRNLARPVGVMMDGRWLSRSELDRLSAARVP